MPVKTPLHSFSLHSELKSLRGDTNTWPDAPYFLRLSFHPVEDKGSNWCRVLTLTLGQEAAPRSRPRRKSQLQIRIFRPGVSSLWFSTCVLLPPWVFVPLPQTSVAQTAATSSPSLGKIDVTDLLTACYTASLLGAGVVQTQEALTSDLSYQWETWTSTAHSSSTSSTIWLTMIFLVSNSADEWLFWHQHIWTLNHFSVSTCFKVLKIGPIITNPCYT